ncbi:MAG: alkaline phosphatase family protein, partial [Balneolaceae bacterium]
MAEVSRDRIIVLDDMIDPKDLEIIEYSPAVMANVKNGKLEEVYTSLKKNEGNFRVYLKADIPERYHLKNHYRVPEFLVVAELGYTINTREFFGARTGYPSGGAHGFDNKEREMYGIFLANGPDIKEGFQMKAFESVHLYALMAHLMDVKPVETDGSLDSIKVIMQ